MSNDIGNIIFNTFKSVTGKSTTRAEIDSWAKSLEYMERVTNDPAIPDDAGVAIEYHIPRSNKRIDFILTGKDAQNAETAILVELKQWQHASLTGKDAIVSTTFHGGPQETAHPSYQAWTYKRLLEDFNATVQEERIRLYPCAYLHNYEPDGVIDNQFYQAHIANAPLFLKSDAVKLQDFIKRNIKYGDKTGRDGVMYRIEQGRIKPSKTLADSLASMIQGNEEFIMVDDQKLVFETAVADFRRKHATKLWKGPFFS